MHVLRLCAYYLDFGILLMCRMYYLSFLALLFHLFWMDVLFLKNWVVVVDHRDVAMIGCVICCCAVYPTPPLKT